MRAPGDGVFKAVKKIGDMVKAGDIVAYVEGKPVKAAIPGIIRGLLRDGTPVTKGLKAGDVDPRGNKEYCYTISDKGRTISGGVPRGYTGAFQRIRGDCYRCQRPDSRQRPVARGVSLPGSLSVTAV